MSADGASQIEVRGRFAGGRGLVGWAFSVFPDPFGVRNHLRGVWARLTLKTDVGVGHLEFEGTSLRSRGPELRIARFAPEPVARLREFLDAAGRRLDAYGSRIPSADVAWTVARLHLVFDQREEATAAVHQGMRLLRAAPPGEVDLEDLRLLDRQLRTCSCFAAAEQLSGYLAARPG